MVCSIKGGTQAKVIQKYDPEANIRMRMGSGEGFRIRNFIVCTVSPNIVRVIKFRRLRWAGHVARMKEGRSALKILKDSTYREQTFRKD